MSRIVLAMSGGVDSSVAAALLLEQGHDVIGVFMRHGEQSPVACARDLRSSKRSDSPAASPGVSAPGEPLPILDRLDHQQGCCTAADAEDARRVADRLAIPFYALDLNAEFARIIDYFAAEYWAGRTPNPCVRCNEWIKFGKLFDYADAVGAEFVATGHYARIARDGGTSTAGVRLLRGVDGGKDQSYALFGVRRQYLERMLLPVGDFDKPSIRRRAAELGLAVAQKRDSQEICFVTRGRYDELVRGRAAPGSEFDADRAGDIVLADGTVVGRHDGVEGFTVGQRKGLGVALGEPRFVMRIEPDSRRVVLGTRDEAGRSELVADQCNWLVDQADLPQRCDVQIRYNGTAAPAAIRLDDAGWLHVAFDDPQFAVAPGQAAVCYADERLLGGGWIRSA